MGRPVLDRSPHEPSVPARFDGSVPPPDFVSIETTRFCNLRCRMCLQYNDGSTVAGPHMPIEAFERIAASVFPFVRRWQPSVSGEPTMTRDFTSMLAIAERFGVKAEMVTNATLLDDDMVAKLAPNIALVMISFDAAKGETFEAIREGADFERVCANVRRLIAHCRASLPADLQPQFGINCTLMERNVRELPDLVRLASEDLGVDFVSCFHVYPVTDEMCGQSLVHHRELASACLDEAFRVADRLGMPLAVEALDEPTAAAAFGGSAPPESLANGVAAGFERRETQQERRGRLPLLDEGRAGHAAILARRARARAELEHVRAAGPDGGGNAASDASIWWCDFLWNKSYVLVDGDVRPCCVAQAPVVGNLFRERFDRLWNNENYRTMRRRLVAKDPVPACRGCLHVREVADGRKIAELLQGRALPGRDGAPLPADLDPQAHTSARRTSTPPVLEWEAVPGARSYVVQFSLDRGSLLFSTDSGRSPAVHKNRYEVPVWAWRQAPVDRPIYWRVLAKVDGAERVASEGTIPAEA